MNDSDKVTPEAVKFRRLVSDYLMPGKPMIPCLVQLNVADLRRVLAFCQSPAHAFLNVRQSMSCQSLFAAFDTARQNLADAAKVDIDRWQEYAERDEGEIVTPRLGWH